MALRNRGDCPNQQPTATNADRDGDWSLRNGAGRLRTPTQREWAERLPRARMAGGELKSACPACGGDDRFRVMPDGRFFCRQCCQDGRDPAAMRRILNAVGFGNGPSVVDTSRYGRPPPGPEPPKSGTAGRVPEVMAAARGCAGTHAEDYLIGRGAWPRGSHAPPVRWLPPGDLARIAPPNDRPAGADGGAVVYPLYGGRGGVVCVRAVALEALAAKGGRLPGGSRWRRTWGPRKGCVFVAHSPPTTPKSVIVAEGQCDALASFWTHCPCPEALILAACGSVADLPLWPLPPGAPVLIEADSGRAGHDGAERLAARLRACGKSVTVSHRETGDPASEAAPMVRSLSFDPPEPGDGWSWDADDEPDGIFGMEGNDAA